VTSRWGFGEALGFAEDISAEIPMTSERNLAGEKRKENAGIKPDHVSFPTCKPPANKQLRGNIPDGFSEPSATIFFFCSGARCSGLASKPEEFVLWYAFPWTFI
jgi:hypothetical protein